MFYQHKVIETEHNQLQTLIADLQSQASGLMTAEKQSTWTDECWKADGTLRPQPETPLKRDQRI